MKMTSATTKYGRQVYCRFMLDGQQESIFLPARYTTMSDADLERFHKGEYAFVVEAQVGRTWKLKIIDNTETQWP